MAYLGIVADDLTGATTTGVLLARSGVRTNVYFHEKAVKRKAEKFREKLEDAIVISTNSRASKTEKAYEAVKHATDILKRQGCRYFQKRIDTTMRGRIGIEIDAMMDVLGEETIAVVVPAMPGSRRILVGGYSVIDGTALVNTPAARDVRTPVKENYIPKLLAAQTKEKVGLVALDRVLEGKEAVAEAMAEKCRDGCRVIVVDAISDKDIREIAGACIELQWEVLSVDPGPFTAEFARQRGLANQERDGKYSSRAGRKKLEHKVDDLKKSGRAVLIAAGSATEVTKRQIHIFCANTQAYQISVNPELLLDQSETAEKEIARAADKAIEILKTQKDIPAILFETALHGVLLNLDIEDQKRGYSSGMCADKINEGLGKIILKVMGACGKDRIAGLYMTGGDTMVHVCRQLGAECLEALDYVIPQTDVSRLADGEYRGMTVIGKGGMTGYDEIVADIVEAILKQY